MKTKALLLTAVLLGGATAARAQQPQPDPDDPTGTQPAPGDPKDPIPDPGTTTNPDQPATPESPAEPATNPEPTTTEPAPAPAPVVVTPPPAEPAPTNITVTPTPVRVTPVVEEPTYIDRVGVSMTLGAGVSGFIDRDTRDFTQPGAGWQARLAIGTRELLGLELGYTGSAQAIDALGLDSDAMLVSNGMDADLRLNLGPETTVQPFVFGGMGWRHYNVTNTSTRTSSVKDNDDVLEFPVGAGLGFRAAGVALELRGTFRPASDSDLMGGNDNIDIPGDLNPDPINDPAARDSKSTLHNWSATLGAGFEF
ncbi:MAG TPA: outer membrane beta-barrel protein [Kofleriaceae bacterium]|jgi:hypothetical protein|nr:outer membrane beta-barrel protein [Kofleriaceae bacterium]